MIRGQREIHYPVACRLHLTAGPGRIRLATRRANLPVAEAAGQCANLIKMPVASAPGARGGPSAVHDRLCRREFCSITGPMKRFGPERKVQMTGPNFMARQVHGTCPGQFEE